MSSAIERGFWTRGKRDISCFGGVYLESKIQEMVFGIGQHLTREMAIFYL